MNPAESLLLPPLSMLYSAGIRLRLAAYRRHWFSVHSLGVPVVSVGNLTAGGTGKTPLVEWFCRALANEGKRVCVLTRGYGRRNASEQVVASDGRKILADVTYAGDEPLLLARKLLGVAAVVCNANRASAGEWAIKNLGTEVFVLDDGFQHLQLARDLNVVTIDATNPWGGGLLPYGRLREPVSGLTRADCIVLTRTDEGSDLASLTTRVQNIAGNLPLFHSRMITRALRYLDGRVAPRTSEPLAAFCGLGNPNTFFRHLEREGYSLALKRAFPDHFNYQQTDLDKLAAEAKAAGAKGLVTTEKDAVKLSSLRLGLPCYVLDIQIAIAEEDAVLLLLRDRVLTKNG